MRVKSALIELTNLCNFAGCIYCSSNSQKLTRTEFQNLNTFFDALKTKWISIVTQLIDVGVEEIEISGGEPMIMHKLIHDILTLCVLYGVKKIKIFTNGLQPFRTVELVERFLRTVASRGSEVELEIWISRDYPRHALNIAELLYMHNVELLYHNQDLLLKKLNDLKMVYGDIFDNYVKVGVHFILTRYNIEFFRDVVDEVSKFNVVTYIKPIRLVLQGRARSRLNLQPSDAKVKTFFKELIRLIKDSSRKLHIVVGCPVNFMWFIDEYMNWRIIDSKLTLGEKCPAGEEHIYVTPDGVVKPCVAFKDVVAVNNKFVIDSILPLEFGRVGVSGTKIADILDSEERMCFIHWKRSWVNPMCKTCKYFTLCGGKCFAQRLRQCCLNIETCSDKPIDEWCILWREVASCYQGEKS